MLESQTPSTSTLTTPVKPKPNRSLSSTTTSNFHLVSPSLLRRIASSSSTSTVRLSKDHAGQSGLREEHPSVKDDEDDPTLNLNLTIPGGSSRSRSRTPSLVQRHSDGSPSVRSRGSRASSSGSKSQDQRSSPVPNVNVVQVTAEGDPGGLRDARIGLKRLITSDDSVGIQVHQVGITPAGMMGDGKGKARQDSFSPRRYYILTNAGKPVFDSLDIEGDQTTNMMGVIQAIISIYAEMGDGIRSVRRGKHKVHFLLRAPIFLFCTSDWGEPDFVLRIHLEHLHLQVLSVMTEGQLRKVFQRQSNFDLGRLLEGTEHSLHTLLDDLQTDLTFMASALQPMRLAPALRDAAGQVLAPSDKIKDLLYVLLLVNDKVVTLLRPRKHSIHPTDLHLLMNVLKSSPGLKSSETWLPLCLPKFNPNGFVYALIDYIKENIGLVFVSADREGFEPLQGWKRKVVRKLEDEHILGRLELAALAAPYLSIEAGYPGLRHFWYKSRQNVQVTMPIWESPYDEMTDERRRLITVYQRLYDAIHARSGQAHTLKQDYIRSEDEACLAWITPGFELYVCVEPHLPKSGAVAAANAVARWVRKQESWMFLKEAPVF